MIDFGLSAVIESGKLQNTFCGSPAYAAPEILEGKNYVGMPVDVWSLGVLMYLLVAKRLPFENVQKTLMCQWLSPENISDDCRDLLSKMLKSDPSARPTMQDVLVHPWLSG